MVRAAADAARNRLYNPAIYKDGKDALSFNAQPAQKAYGDQKAASAASGKVPDNRELLSRKAPVPADLTTAKERLEDLSKPATFLMPVSDISAKSALSAMPSASLPADLAAEKTKISSAVDVIVKEAESEEDMAGREELKEAADEFIAITERITESQAILNEQDVAAIKDAFDEFNKLKIEIMAEYRSATDEYYGDMKGAIEANSAVLAAKGLITKELLEKGLSSLSRQDMDKLLKRINSSSDKSREVQSILELSSGHKKAYADFMKNMATLMDRFTKKFSYMLSERGAIQASKPAKEGPVPPIELPVK